MQKKLKIAVYAIAKNEEKHVKRFCESAKDADMIIITDTGSEDKTVEIAKECGAIVNEVVIYPFRFDVARNAALAAVPKDVDICVSMDLDEVLLPGWREEIEACWEEDISRLNIGFDFGEGRTFYPSRVHNRFGYYWKYPCHEYITPDIRLKDVCGQTKAILMSHQPDQTKSRSQYLDLLIVAVKEDPNCHRSSYYYGRELYFKGEWQGVVNELTRYLSLPTATWPLERSHAMRMIAISLDKLEKNGLAWFRKATIEEPNIRENWFDLAMTCYQKGLWQESYYAAKTALTITDNIGQHTCSAEAWGYLPYDLVAIAAWNLGLKEEARKYGLMAIERDPKNSRLIQNQMFYNKE